MSEADRDDERPSQSALPVTSMTLRAERLRRRFAQAAGAKVTAEDPGLSRVAAPRDPELTNVSAVVAIVAGIVAVFANVVFVPSVVAVVFGVLGLRRARVLVTRGKKAFGRRRCLWALGLGGFGALTVLYHLLIAPLF